MGEQMMFPETFEEFAEQHKIVDKEQVYTNGSELIPVFRVKQWLERPITQVVHGDEVQVTAQSFGHDTRSFYEGILTAQSEARKQNIIANAVFINDKLYFSKLSDQFLDIPIICGLKAFYTDELPDNTLFAVAEVDHLPSTNEERLTALESENARLRRKLDAIQIICNRGEDV